MMQKDKQQSVSQSKASDSSASVNNSRKKGSLNGKITDFLRPKEPGFV